uniref:Uncharacterized protein n=1 Tax=Anguilla anguilla TaxID=7936 RepID=A0A0E9SLQ4_ANGAN
MFNATEIHNAQYGTCAHELQCVFTLSE